MRGWLILLALLATPSGPARGLDLALPGSAKLAAEVVRDPDSYMLPVAAYNDGALPMLEVEGRVLQQAWRITQTRMTTLQMIRPLREQLATAGYDIILDCGGLECGGFDFRFNTQVLAAPHMYVDLFDFRFLSARKGGTGGDENDSVASVLVSLAGGAGYVQIIHVTANGGEDKLRVDAKSTAAVAVPEKSVPVIRALTGQGHVILKDLNFGTGSSALGNGPHHSLSALASFLLADGTRRIALVGHTDHVGSLSNNVALSRRRAVSVLQRLVDAYDVPRGQVEAEGVGYLSPLAPNDTQEGREANRRVEAVLLSAE